MFCLSRDAALYAVLQNGFFAFLAGALFTAFAISIWREARDYLRSRRRGR